MRSLANQTLGSTLITDATFFGTRIRLAGSVDARGCWFAVEVAEYEADEPGSWMSDSRGCCSPSRTLRAGATREGEDGEAGLSIVEFRPASTLGKASSTGVVFMLARGERE